MNDGKSEGGTKVRGRNKRASRLRSTPLYGCSPGCRFVLVTRFYCLVANYRSIVINQLRYALSETMGRGSLFSAKMTCSECRLNRITESSFVSELKTMALSSTCLAKVMFARPIDRARSALVRHFLRFAYKNENSYICIHFVYSHLCIKNHY